MAQDGPNKVVVERERSSSVGTVIAIVVGIIILIALVVYGLPYLTGANGSGTDVNVQTPTPASGN